MATNTTQTEEQTSVAEAPVPKAGVPTDPIKKQIYDLYVGGGTNLYGIAKEVLGFDSEEAVKRVLDVVTELFPEV